MWDYLAFCEWAKSDTAALFQQWREWKGGAYLSVPADIIDDVIEAVVGFRIVICKLAPDRLGETDFDQNIVRINEDPRKGLKYKNADLNGLSASTKGHELGHIRCRHERYVRHLQVGRVLPRTVKTSMDLQAEAYSQTFLMPEEMILSCPEVEMLRQFGSQLEVKDIWREVIYPLARRFKVTPSNMKSRLKALKILYPDDWEAGSASTNIAYPINIS